MWFLSHALAPTWCRLGSGRSVCAKTNGTFHFKILQKEVINVLQQTRLLILKYSVPIHLHFPNYGFFCIHTGSSQSCYITHPSSQLCSICPFIHLGACAAGTFSHTQCLLNFTEIESVLQSLQKTNQFKASINLNSWHLQLLSISLGIFDCLQSLMCGVRRALRLLCSGQGVRISTNEALAWVCGANQELRVVQISQD